MTHLEKMSRFASQADSFINAALDQLDDAVEQVVVTGGAAEADPEVAKHVLDPAALRDVRLATTFWGDLDLARRREEWRDAAVAITDSRERAEASKRALADAARRRRRRKGGDVLAALAALAARRRARRARQGARGRGQSARIAMPLRGDGVPLGAQRPGRGPDPAGPLATPRARRSSSPPSHADAENANRARRARGPRASVAPPIQRREGRRARDPHARRGNPRRPGGRSPRGRGRAPRGAAERRTAANAPAVAEEQLRAARGRDDAQSRVFELEERRSADAAAAEADPRA